VNNALPKPHQFQPGNRLGGRPLGSRNRLTETALQMLGEHFAEFGKEAIDRVYREQPGTYLKIVASLLPRQVSIEKLSPLHDLSDEELVLLERTLSSSRAQVIEHEPEPEPEPEPEKP
jgi:hypothetical protein